MIPASFMDELEKTAFIAGVGKFLATSAAGALKNIGATRMSAEAAGLGKQMMRPGATIGKSIDYAAKNLVQQTRAVKGNAPVTRPWLGKETSAVGVMAQKKPSLIGGLIGETARAAQTIKNAPNPIKGVFDVVKNNWNESKFFTKEVGGKTYKFRRSTAGRIISPALNSGLGFGALEAATMKNEDGSTPSIGKRLLKGGTTAIAWGAAPKLMTGKMLAYDLPKNFIGKPKQPPAPDLPTQF